VIAIIRYGKAWRKFLEDYGAGQWNLMHSADVPGLFGRYCRYGEDYFLLISVHTEFNLIYLIDVVSSTLRYG
jgi:hypothetical protein